ncbi:YpmS family protein [Ureibacillus suwonensis]|mgnify:FL=1|uniref:YpmS family protein n=1 Tax=Ureibacillus suwonensis TaxID=313007 RepID=A0ABW0RFI3_9BACL
MNVWKVAFFTLSGAIVLLLALLIYWATSPVKTSVPSAEEPEAKETDSVLYVETTADDFEKLAIKYIKRELKNSALPVEIEVNDSIQISSEIVAFGYNVPVLMKFNPVVNEHGNIHLVQSEVNVGSLNLPPSMVLKLLDQAVQFPEWMVIRPDAKEIFVDLSNLTLSSGAKVKAKEIDLKNNQIQLEIVIPNQ